MLCFSLLAQDQKSHYHVSVKSKRVTFSAKSLGVIYLTSLRPSLMCSAYAASVHLDTLLLCVGAMSSPSPSCWEPKGEEDLTPQKPLLKKACGRKTGAITVGLSFLSAPTCGWAVEGGEQLRQEQRVLLHCRSVLSGQFWLALHCSWCAFRHPASPRVLANLCCRGLGLIPWVTVGHSYQE